jgi:hypothetical protein
VSHNKIRAEKICLNCGTETTGRYCPNCGQQNLEPKQSVWHLINHFFTDITHFDGKFFLTVRDLFARPGFLSREYMIGRRASYLDPIRMYIFTSAIFFLIFFSLFDAKKIQLGDETKSEIQKDPEIGEIISKAKIAVDSVKKARDTGKAEKPGIKNYGDSAKIKHGIKFKTDTANFSSFEAYDSLQKKMPSSQRDGWLKRKFMSRKIVLTQRYEKEHSNLVREMINNFLHNFPKMLFISLPAFAFILKLLYFRRKQFYYVDHGIFAIHLYIFSFLVMLAYIGVDQLNTATNWNWLFWLMGAIVIYPLFYYYKAMRRFYGQRRWKTILKFILLFVMSFFVQLLIFIFFMVFTVFEA